MARNGRRNGRRKIDFVVVTSLVELINECIVFSKVCCGVFDVPTVQRFQYNVGVAWAQRWAPTRQAKNRFSKEIE